MVAIKVTIAITPLILALLVAPVRSFMNNNPYISWSLLIFYGIGVIVFPVAKKIWKKLEPLIVEAITDYIEHHARLIFSKFYKRYVTKLRSQHRFFNVKGITIQSTFSLELQKVFVDLQISPPRPSRLKTAKSSLERPKNIWELLESKDPGYRIVAIIGKPGSGKTTLLQYVTLLIAIRKATRRTKRYIPFHLPLRKYVKDVVASSIEALDLASLLERDLQELKPPVGWVEHKLKNYGHRCVVLLDGLDEVADADNRKKLTTWVEHQAIHYGETRFVITSRPHGYEPNAIQGATVLHIEDFSQEQIYDFVQKWYHTTEIAAASKTDKMADIIQRAEDNATDLIQRIFQSDILSKLAVNPLLLTMITMVHRYVGKLPEMRAALYEDIIRVLLGRREETFIKGIRLSYFQKRAILQTLALVQMQQRKREISTSEAIAIIGPDLQSVNIKPEDGPHFLETMMKESGLLMETDPGFIAFAHLTYQEFLTAAEIKNRKMEDSLVNDLGDSWWHETILLYAATSDATGIVQACLNQPQRSLENLKLAYEISQEAMQIAPKERKRLEDLLVLEADSADREAQQFAADLIFEIRLKRMVRRAPNVDIDRFFISHLEYQSFIHNTNRRPDHWSGLRYSFREGLKPIVGVRRDDAEAFARWLTVRAARELGHRTSKFRLPTEEEASLVKTDQEVQDQNFKHLANPEVGAWVMPANVLVFSEKEKSAASSYWLRMRVVGESETHRVGDYHSSIDSLLEELDKQIEDLRKELQAAQKRLDDAILPSVLSALPVEIDRYIERLNEIRNALRDAVSRAQKRSFNLTLDDGMINELPADLIELNRLRSGRAGAEEYQDTDAGKIRGFLSNARVRLESLRGVLYDPVSRARQCQQNLMNLLSTELNSFAGKPIDLDQQLAFLSKLGDIRLSTNEIQAVLRREIGKDYTKAKSELLALAEYALYQNKTELLREILRGFWAVFFIEQRANRQNPLPAWEGIRLVREIRRPDEETTII
ncbi:NACHT domain-containing protein [candidate division KSB1 bacterium]|nr:NACHT domain-containing protein [bacterium]NUM67804.1 NACHT domain-containing protein [candidate division KSB1 bacterium]